MCVKVASALHPGYPAPAGPLGSFTETRAGPYQVAVDWGLGECDILMDSFAYLPWTQIDLLGCEETKRYEYSAGHINDEAFMKQACCSQVSDLFGVV